MDQNSEENVLRLKQGQNSYSSDSDADIQTSDQMKTIRKVSTRRQLRRKKCIKEGILLKQTSSSFQRWKQRYFKLKSCRLFYAKTEDSEIFNEIDLNGCSVAETSHKNINCSFSVIGSTYQLILCAETRKGMDEWITAIRAQKNHQLYSPDQSALESVMEGHNWYACAHSRPTYCNVCREALSGVTNHGLSCDVCTFKAHKKCASRATASCKWSNLSSTGKNIVEDEDGIYIIHQWLEGNLPVNAKCVVCEKTCGSVLRLQDWKCLWCRSVVHSSCRIHMPTRCTLGSLRHSIVTPTAIHSYDSNGYWIALPTPQCRGPLLVFVNSRSGDNQGVKFLRRFRQYLNPAQVFDLACCGPKTGLKMFQKLETIRVLICSGDGSVGWVLSEVDRCGLSNKMRVGVLPLGTGNDLAQVMGWGGACDDDMHVSTIVERYERASIKLLDRWSVLTYERLEPFTSPAPLKEAMTSSVVNDTSSDVMTSYHRVQPDDEKLRCEATVADHLAMMLDSNQHDQIISSAAALCKTIRNFVTEVGCGSVTSSSLGDGDVDMANKYRAFDDKVSSLMKTLTQEAAEAEKQFRPAAEILRNDDDGVVATSSGRKKFRSRTQVMLRANSLKKAARKIIEHTERVLDEQNELSDQQMMMTSLPPISEIETLHASSIVTLEGDLSSATTQPIASSSRDFNSAGFFLNPDKKRLLINPLYSQSSKSSFIEKALLANAQAVCAPATPVCNNSTQLLNTTEKCVMNNYFGIGLDAKISLEFHRRREEHPKKFSRIKNRMWYTMLGAKELAVRTFKNLEQRIKLECDGELIHLPPLQGIVILNIPSYMGGANFWGTKEANEIFIAPSYNDKLLEVMAVFSSRHLGMAIVVPDGVLQHHRIAQCQSVKISVLGEESIPLEVDGEAWMQPPGVITIQHKNTIQMLARDRRFETALKSWELKQRTCPRRSAASSNSCTISDTELLLIAEFIETVTVVTTGILETITTNELLSNEVGPLATLITDHVKKIKPQDAALTEEESQKSLLQVVKIVQELNQKLHNLLECHSEALGSGLVSKVFTWLEWFEMETNKLNGVKWFNSLLHKENSKVVKRSQSTDTVGTSKLTEACSSSKKSSSKSKFGVFTPLFKRSHKKEAKTSSSNRHLNHFNVINWNLTDVGIWLESISLQEYIEDFIKNDVEGKELLRLDTTDLKEIGVNKIGHVKRLQAAIKDLQMKN